MKPSHKTGNRTRRTRPGARLAHILAGVMALFTFHPTAKAVTLDWNNVLVWHDGQLTGNINNIGGSGIDMNITIVQSDGTFLSGFPQVSNYYTGGKGNSQDALIILTDFAKRNSSYIDVTMTFSTAVNDVSFSFLDLDIGDPTGGRNNTQYTFQDEIANLTGSLNGESAISPSSVVTHADNTYSGGSILGTSPAATTSSSGNADISFTQAVNQISFRYQPGPDSENNPNEQGIGISDISFVPAVPEGSTATIGSLALLLVGLRFLRGMLAARHRAAP